MQPHGPILTKLTDLKMLKLFGFISLGLRHLFGARLSLSVLLCSKREEPHKWHDAKKHVVELWTRSERRGGMHYSYAA